MKHDPVFQVAVLSALVFAAEWLGRRPRWRHVGSAMLVILLTAICANIGLLPTFEEGSPIYSGVFEYVAPLAIFWLLLGVDLTRVLEVGARMLALFLGGALGTFLGVLLAMRVVGGEAAFGENYAALGGMFVGTYTGGSVNFNALASELGVAEDGVLYAGATAVDNIMTAVWMAATLALPRLFSRGTQRPEVLASGTDVGDFAHSDGDREAVHPMDMGVLLALGAFSFYLSKRLAAWSGGEVPSILILTTFALLLAPLPFVKRLPGSRLLGMFAVQIFLAVIGALCDAQSLASLGTLGPRLLLFVSIILLVHAGVLLSVARLVRADPDAIAVASQANIGGGTTALAVARSLGRADLAVPAILVGSIGTALGTFAGFAAVRLL